MEKQGCQETLMKQTSKIRSVLTSWASGWDVIFIAPQPDFFVNRWRKAKKKIAHKRGGVSNLIIKFAEIREKWKKKG